MPRTRTDTAVRMKSGRNIDTTTDMNSRTHSRTQPHMRLDIQPRSRFGTRLDKPIHMSPGTSRSRTCLDIQLRTRLHIRLPGTRSDTSSDTFRACIRSGTPIHIRSRMVSGSRLHMRPGSSIRIHPGNNPPHNTIRTRSRTHPDMPVRTRSRIRSGTTLRTHPDMPTHTMSGTTLRTPPGIRPDTYLGMLSGTRLGMQPHIPPRTPSGTPIHMWLDSCAHIRADMRPDILIGTRSGN